MRLTDLNPRWVGYGGEGVTITATGEPVPYRAQVGVSLDCHCGCDRPLTVKFSNPVDGLGRVAEGTYWERVGEDFETLTLTPSIQRRIPDCWHGYITNGEIVTL